MLESNIKANVPLPAETVNVPPEASVAPEVNVPQEVVVSNGRDIRRLKLKLTCALLAASVSVCTAIFLKHRWIDPVAVPHTDDTALANAEPVKPYTWTSGVMKIIGVACATPIGIASGLALLYPKKLQGFYLTRKAYGSITHREKKPTRPIGDFTYKSACRLTSTLFNYVSQGGGPKEEECRDLFKNYLLNTCLIPDSFDMDQCTIQRLGTAHDVSKIYYELTVNNAHGKGLYKLVMTPKSPDLYKITMNPSANECSVQVINQNPEEEVEE